MIKKIFFLFTLFFLVELKAYSANITEDAKFYYVNNVKAEDIATSEVDSVKNTALNAVKRQALNDLMVHLNKGNAINDVNLEGAISAFKIVDEHYEKDFYSIIANFTFNKNVIKSMLEGADKYSKNKNVRFVDGVVALYEKNNLISEFVAFRDYLRKHKITFSPEYITAQEIRIRLYKVDEDTIYGKLKELNLNGKMYLDTL